MAAQALAHLQDVWVSIVALSLLQDRLTRLHAWRCVTNTAPGLHSALKNDLIRSTTRDVQTMHD